MKKKQKQLYELFGKSVAREFVIDDCILVVNRNSEYLTAPSNFLSRSNLLSLEKKKIYYPGMEWRGKTRPEHYKRITYTTLTAPYIFFFFVSCSIGSVGSNNNDAHTHNTHTKDKINGPSPEFRISLNLCINDFQKPTAPIDHTIGLHTIFECFTDCDCFSDLFCFFLSNSTICSYFFSRICVLKYHAKIVIAHTHKAFDHHLIYIANVRRTGQDTEKMFNLFFAIAKSFLNNEKKVIRRIVCSVCFDDKFCIYVSCMADQHRKLRKYANIYIRDTHPNDPKRHIITTMWKWKFYAKYL